VTPTFPGLCASAVYEWIALYPDNNNNILTAMQTANRCLVSTIWTGGAFFGTVTEHDGTNTVESAASRSFDFAWEKLPSSSGKGWLLWDPGHRREFAQSISLRRRLGRAEHGARPDASRARRRLVASGDSSQARITPRRLRPPIGSPSR